jgi:hypothetical protein
VTAHAAGSDSYVTKCIWRAGFGLTDPGYSYMTRDPTEHFTFDRWTFRVRLERSLSLRTCALHLPVQTVERRC